MPLTRNHGRAPRTDRTWGGRALLVAFLGVLALLSACASDAGAGTVPPRAYEPAPCPNPIYPGVPAVDLGAGVECGYLTVPENRARPDGRTIRLAVARAKATSPTPRADPLLYLAGGPGGSGLISAATRIAAGWNRDRDVIFLDQRGTWKSDPLLSCPEIDTFLADWAGLNSFDPATAERSATATRTCRDRLAASGADLAAYTTPENAADVADLRVALGIPQWNLYGVSYGTDLALQTLRDHPEGIRSVVLDSVVPPQANTILSFWPSAASGLSAMFDACAAQPACRKAAPALRDDFFGLVGALTTAPRTVTVPDPATGRPTPVVVDGYKLMNFAITASLVPGTIATVPETVENLAHGDGRTIATALLASAPPSGVTSYGLALGVFCSEAAATITSADLVAAGRAALPGVPDAVLARSPQAPFLLGDCRSWAVPPAPEAVSAPVNSTVPVLILDGGLDAITAPPNGELVARSLPRATRVPFADSAHDVLLWSTPCALPVMESFLDAPSAPDTRCAGSVAPAPFAP
jgi:pimeloyl-ACP methyl ester carboxylesterase